ncbi:hypothetical protein GGF32_003766 [Allomyces javanicus]|nr:hypothetical protein GGF32_003766 [Allomyces javanicus]
MIDPLVAKEYQAATRARSRVARCGAVAYWLGVFLLIAFAVGMMIVLQIVVLKGKVYPSQTSNIGWAVHAWPGLVYFIIGFCQFSDRFRHAYPRAHRIVGWTYLVLTAVTIIGMIILLIGGSHAGESAVLFAITGGVLWVSLLVLATKAIMRGDVGLHRRYHLVAFIMSFSIVPMRIGVVILAGITGLSTDEVLKTVLWWGLTWFFVGGELYLYYERKTTPAATVMLPTASNSAPGDASVLPMKVNDSNTLAPWIPAVLVEGEYLNARTVRVVFAAANDAAGAHVPRLVVPGQHVALAHKNGKREVVRSYSPTTSPFQAHRGHIELVAHEGLVIGVGLCALVLITLITIWVSCCCCGCCRGCCRDSQGRNTCCLDSKGRNACCVDGCCNEPYVRGEVKENESIPPAAAKDASGVAAYPQPPLSPPPYTQPAASAPAKDTGSPTADMAASSSSSAAGGGVMAPLYQPVDGKKPL